MTARILLTDDDLHLADGLSRLLHQEGYQVQVATTAMQALERARHQTPDLIILDVGLPDISGVEACRQLRTFWSGPIVMLSGRRHELDEVVGLDAGADDYFTKPFSPHRLLARIRAHLRRSSQPSVGPPVRGAVDVGALSIDPDARSVAGAGQSLSLSAREFDLLLLLAERAGHVLTRQYLFDTVWGPDFSGDTHVLDVYISLLRKKLVQAGLSGLLTTVRGVGYRIEPSDLKEANPAS